MKGKAETIRKIAVAAMCVAGLAVAPTGSAASAPIVVTDTTGLQNALAGAKAGQRILMRPGTYRVGSTVAVPDGVSLEGSGVMQGPNLPTGFKPGTETAIVALPELTGDVVTLGDGASLRALSVQEVVRRPGGNAVGVVSRHPADSVTASIVECQIVNPNVAGGGPDGPTGGGVAVLTRNLAAGESPPPDRGAFVTLTMSRSIVRAEGGAPAVFAINSATDGRLDLQLTQDVVAGRLDAVGGVSRGDEVVGASIAIESSGNLYAPTKQLDSGWSIIGGSQPPFSLPGAAGTSSNHVRVDSTGDRIEGAVHGIDAIAGRRFGTNAGPSSGNTVELNLQGLTVRTVAVGDAEPADFAFAAAACFCPQPTSPGDNNTLSVLMRDTTGSGMRANVYENVLTPVLGVGNVLQFLGTAAAFQESNRRIDPAPRDELFIG